MPTTLTKIDTKFLCEWCAGNGFVPHADLVSIGACTECDGTGYRTAVGDLGQTHSEPKRPYRYEPGCRRLTLWKGRKATTYTIGEFVPDRGFTTAPARAFTVVKEADGETRCVLISREGCTCDCEGATYAGSDKANVRAARAGEKTFPTLGCKHLDAVALLLREGWLDLPEGGPGPHSEGSEGCGYCCGRGTVPGPTHDGYGYELEPRDLVCEYCGGSGVCVDGGKLLAHRGVA